MPRLALALCLLAPACSLYTGADPIDGGGAPPGDATAAGCAPEPSAPGATILACGFGPDLVVVGVDADGVYAQSAVQTYFRAPLAGGRATRLFQANDSPTTVAASVLATTVAGHALVFPSVVPSGAYASLGLVAISTTAPTIDAPRTVIAGGTYTPFAPVISDGNHLYAASTISDGGDGAFTGPVIQMNLDGSQVQAVTDLIASPVAVVDGYLYFLRGLDLARVPLGGGASQTIVPGLAETAYGDRAIAGGYVYTTTAADPYTIQRFPVTGGPGEPVYAVPRGGEIPGFPPTALRVDGDSLYFIESGDLQTDLGTLFRLPLGAPDLAGGLLSSVMGPPAFDAGHVYVAFQRGGGDAPIEGVIAAFAK